MDWLTSEVSVSDLEDTLGGPDWRRVKGCIAPGDELWTFSSPGNQGQKLVFRAGIALVRNGQPIDHVITAMS